MVTYTYNTIKRAVDDNAIKLGAKVRTNGTGGSVLSSNTVSGIIGYIDDDFFYIFHNDSNNAGSTPNNWDELKVRYGCEYSWAVKFNNTDAWLEVDNTSIIINAGDIKEGMRIRFIDYLGLGVSLEGIASFCRGDYAFCVLSNDIKFAGHTDRREKETNALKKYNCEYSYGLSSLPPQKIEVIEQIVVLPQDIQVAFDCAYAYTQTLLKGGEDMEKVTIYQITVIDKKDEKITVKKEVAAGTEVKALIKFGVENADVLKAVDFKNIEIISTTIATFDKVEEKKKE